MASDILGYNVVQDHEGISIKGYRGLKVKSISHYRICTHSTAGTRDDMGPQGDESLRLI